MLGQLMKGAAAGTAAAIPMTAYWEYMHRTVPGEPPRPLPPREIVEAAVVKAGVSRQLSERDVQNLTLAAHFGYAAATGALFATMAPARAGGLVGAGALFGAGVWAVSYLGWLPASGLRQHPRYDLPARTALMIGGHLVWGVALGLMLAVGRGRRVKASTEGRAHV